MQRSASGSHVDRRKRKNRAAHHNRTERHQNHQSEQKPRSRAQQNPHGIIFSAVQGTVKAAVQNVVQNEKRKKRSPENSVSRKVSNNLVAHQKNKVREHKNVGDDFKKFSHFHIQNSSQSAFFQPFVDSCIQVAATGIEELKRKPQVAFWQVL